MPLAKRALVHAGIHEVSISRLPFQTNSFCLLSSSLSASLIVSPNWFHNNTAHIRITPWVAKEENN
jgi:hypothetical protein